VQAVGGLELGAVPIASAVATLSFWLSPRIDAFAVRRAEKGHGIGKLIAGPLTRGANVVLVDDVTTTGKSLLQAAKVVRSYDCCVVGAISVLDREEGATAFLAEHDITLTSLVRLSELDRILRNENDAYE